MKIFSCSYCDEVFETSSERDNHVGIVHEKDRPHKCHYKDCDNAYKYRSGLWIHINSYHLKLIEQTDKLLLESLHETKIQPLHTFACIGRKSQRFVKLKGLHEAKQNAPS